MSDRSQRENAHRSPQPDLPPPAMAAVRRDLRRIQRRLNVVLTVVVILLVMIAIPVVVVLLGGTLTSSGAG